MGSLTKARIGKEDLELQTNANTAESFNRTTSTGSTIGLTKIPDIWEYGGAVKAGDVIAKSPWIDVRAYGAVGNGLTNDTEAIQAAIDATEDDEYGSKIIFFPKGIYLISDLYINCSKTHLLGSGVGASRLLYNSAGTAITVKRSGEVVWNCSIKGLTIRSDDVASTKTALLLEDVSRFTLEDVEIRAFNDAGNTSAGVKIYGREFVTFERVQIEADKPIQILENPNSTVDFDHGSINNATLMAWKNADDTPVPHPIIRIDANAFISNTTFGGYQSWVGGTRGLSWDDGETSTPSYNISINNVRWESGHATADYIIYISYDTVTPRSIVGLHLHNLRWGVRADATSTSGIYLRQIYNVMMSNLFYGGTGEMLNINASVIHSELHSIYSQNAATVTTTGTQEIYSAGHRNVLAPLKDFSIYQATTDIENACTWVNGNRFYTYGVNVANTVVQQIPIFDGGITFKAAYLTIVGVGATEKEGGSFIIGATLAQSAIIYGSTNCKFGNNADSLNILWTAIDNIAIYNSSGEAMDCIVTVTMYA